MIRALYLYEVNAVKMQISELNQKGTLGFMFLSCLTEKIPSCL